MQQTIILILLKLPDKSIATIDNIDWPTFIISTMHCYNYDGGPTIILLTL